MDRNRIVRSLVALLLVTVPAGPAFAEIYEEGFTIAVEGLYTSPKDTDQVVGTFSRGLYLGDPTLEGRYAVDWGASGAGRLALGYSWGEGNRFRLIYGSYKGDATATGNGPEDGFLFFAIGPTAYVGLGPEDDPLALTDRGFPGYFDFESEIKAQTLEASFGRAHELSDRLTMEWSLGLQYAKYEETLSGIYDLCATGTSLCYRSDLDLEFEFGDYVLAADKSLEGVMAGLRGTFRAWYGLSESLALTAGMGISLLDGKIRATSGLVPIGSFNVGTAYGAAEVEDKDRSGSIRDLDAALVFRMAEGRARLWFGLERSRWDGIVDDPLRNYAGVIYPLGSRPSVTFSSFKIGGSYRF